MVQFPLLPSPLQRSGLGQFAKAGALWLMGHAILMGFVSILSLMSHIFFHIIPLLSSCISSFSFVCVCVCAFICTHTCLGIHIITADCKHLRAETYSKHFYLLIPRMLCSVNLYGFYFHFHFFLYICILAYPFIKRIIYKNYV